MGQKSQPTGLTGQEERSVRSGWLLSPRRHEIDHVSRSPAVHKGLVSLVSVQVFVVVRSFTLTRRDRHTTPAGRGHTHTFWTPLSRLTSRRSALTGQSA